MSAPERGVPRYRPWPVLCFIGLVLGLPLALRRDLGFGAPESLSVDAAEAAGGTWLGDFAARMFADPFSLTLAWAALACLVFGLAQLGAIAADLRAARGHPAGPAGRAVLFLSGRANTRGVGYLQVTAAWGADALLAPLRLGVTLFPMFGFIGTVVGLSGAIRGLPAAVKDQDQLQPVLDDLYVAFDTTFLGLVGALVCLVAVRLAEPQIDMLLREAE